MSVLLSLQQRGFGMISIQFKNTKLFMSRFLTSDTFDIFLLESAELNLANTFTIDGKVHKEFYGDNTESEAPKYELSPWEMLRGTCFELIKGKHTPLSFKFVMHSSPDLKNSILESPDYDGVRDMVSSLVFILSFRDGKVNMTTGAALSGFSLDKSYEKVWDEYILRFVTKAGLEFDELT